MVPSEQLLAQAAATGMSIACVIVTPEHGRDRRLQFLALFPFKPSIGDVIGLDDVGGPSFGDSDDCIVTGIRMQVVCKKDEENREYRTVLVYIKAVFKDRPKVVSEYDRGDIPV